jgi:hypothetical protein
MSKLIFSIALILSVHCEIRAQDFQGMAVRS